ncbi:MAG: hypothetical protein ACLQU4_00590 [Limisphaerales bacterium]
MTATVPAPVTTAANNPNLQQLQIAPNRTFLPLIFVQVALGIDADKAAVMVEDGQLHPAFNIARAGSGRRDIRVCRQTLLAFKPGQHWAKVNLDDAIAAAMPSCLAYAKNPTIRAVELCARLSCNRVHIANLIEDGELLESRKASIGPGCCPILFYASVVDFLKRRVL